MFSIEKDNPEIDDQITMLLEELKDAKAGSPEESNIADSIEKLKKAKSYTVYWDPVPLLSVICQMATVAGVLYVEGHGDIISSKSFPLISRFK